MPITEDRILRLREFGLSEYAARAYLALLDLGVTEARDISKLTKVPSSKIYHILEQLHEKGLVDILPEFPKKYAPVPFSEYLDKLQSVHRKAADEIVRDREDLARLFSVIGTVEVGDRGNFSVVRGRRNVLEKKLELGNGAKRELLGMLSRGAAGRISHFAEMYSGMKARGVTPRILLPLDAASVPKLADLAGLVDIRAREVDGDATDGNVEILIVDGSRALLVNFVPDDDSLYAGRDVALYTDQEALVSALKALVETQWTRAAHFDARRAEIETGRPPEVTRVYSDERDVARAVAAAV
ncbi:MAG TPA: helix-turn-helix domain-containing protein, partial [Candidatus Thermoplasmatota archaeon]|nr:helix-turn-helix domain-containing protein [Candidatus Thermoplasmatota archaeon]